MDSPDPIGAPGTAASTVPVQVQRSTQSNAPVGAAPSVEVLREMLGEDLQRLSPAKVIALQVLLGGGDDVAAARACGKHRMTIGKWKRENPIFQTCLQNWRTNQVAVICDGMYDMSDLALDNVRAKMVKGDDARLSFAFLRFLATLKLGRRKLALDPDLMPYLPPRPEPNEDDVD